ncbi:ProQ/FINO family protein [Nitrincola sp. MINF-07-Sa-05]|uniref:ProQ/FINO family protein n=1 Tax=Nitrincola salilacus TaxID=3400273 RepID=UPI003917FEA8
MSISSAKAMSELEQLRHSTEQLLVECEQRLEYAERRLNRSIERVESKAVNDSVKVDSEKSGSRNRTKNRAANLAALQELSQAYPAVFSRENVRPLKIGIQEDLIADDKLSKTRIKRALASYVRSPNYLRSLQEGASRIGLDGEPSGEVTASEAEHAKAQLKAYHQLRKERIREQEKQAKLKEKEERLNDKLSQLLNLNQNR